MDLSYYLNWLFFLCGRNHISNNLLKLAEWLFLSNKNIFLKHSWWNYNFRWTRQWTNQRTVFRSYRIVSSNEQWWFQFKQPQRRNIFKSGKTIPISSKQTKGTSSKTNQTTLRLSLSKFTFTFQINTIILKSGWIVINFLTSLFSTG